MSGTVSELSDSSFEHGVLDADGPVVVDFWAPWCGPCRAVSSALADLAAAYPETRFAKLDVDQNPATAARFEILSLPTLLVFRNGSPERRLIGAMPKAKLAAALQPWLERA